MKGQMKFLGLALFTIAMYGFILPEMVSAKDSLIAYGGVALTIIYTLIMANIGYSEMKKRGMFN